MNKLDYARENIITLYEDGFNAEQIGRLYGADQGTVLRLLRANKVKRRSAHRRQGYMTPKNRKAARTYKKLHDGGMTFTAIGEMYGMTKQAIRDRVRRLERAEA